MMRKGFTLIELLVVVSIVGVLATTVSSAVFNATKKTQSSATGQTKNTLAKAAQLYWVDMGFYPPDVNRGWDPGLERPMPWNSDIEDGETLPGSYTTPGTDCSHCPSTWEDIISARWDGPYVTKWPDETAWGGEYDYNYWSNPVTRPGGCVVAAGIYAGAQSNYTGDSDSVVPPDAEQLLIDYGLDDDGCVNSESQLLLHPL